MRIIMIVCVAILLPVCSIRAQKSSKTNTVQTAIFPKGNKGPAANFTGTVWVYPLFANDSIFNCVMGNVTFEPGARSNWHTHPAGQILLVTSGICYTQEKGKPIQVYHKGDVIKCLPGVEHWHGASPDSSMSHISLNVNTENGVVNWLQPVTDAEYNGIKKQSSN